MTTNVNSAEESVETPVTPAETTPVAFEQMDDSLILVELLYGVVTEFAKPEDIAPYWGKTLAELMGAAVDAPQDAEFMIDGEKTAGSFVIPQGFSPKRVQAIKKSGSKG